ncbi:hypothetical protein SAMN05216417_13211 [Nitrosospira multiformis]|uniref:Uncharacterized protein n=1 Tax=Nitrosospira multiformis TaxID=1231 RepID=A0A1I7IYA7_9PROT|nr:hypothetical protein SAMN05216417_13211 [Nitrosospira multiformis]
MLQLLYMLVTGQIGLLHVHMSSTVRISLIF